MAASVVFSPCVFRLMLLGRKKRVNRGGGGGGGGSGGGGWGVGAGEVGCDHLGVRSEG